MQNMFPKDITDSMRMCILSIFWKKDDIIGFFKNNSCTSSDLASVENTSELSRDKIVDIVFRNLNNRNDGGLGQFRSMLLAIINWNTFDPYYFQKLEKLNEDEAKRNINHLKQLQEIRDAKLEEKNKRRKANEENIKKSVDPKIIKNIFLNLFHSKGENGKSLSNQERGYLFEDFLKKLFIYEQVESTSPFRFYNIIFAFKF